MTNSVYQQEVVAPDGTKLKAVLEREPQRGVCTGCYFYTTNCINLRTEQPAFECSPNLRKDGKGIVWIKAEPTTEMTIKTARQKKQALEKELMKLVNTFVEETGLRVKDIHSHYSRDIFSTAHIYRLEVDVDFT